MILVHVTFKKGHLRRKQDFNLSCVLLQRDLLLISCEGVNHLLIPRSAIFELLQDEFCL